MTGKPIDNARVNQYLTRLTGNGRYDAADYALSKRDGQDGLLVTVRERTYAPPILQVAFAVDGSENDDVTYTLLTRLTLMDVAGYRSEWRTDIQFGNTYGAATELYRPFPKGDGDARDPLSHLRRMHHRSDDRVPPSPRQYGGRGRAPHQPVQLRAADRIRPAGGPHVLAGAPESCHPRKIVR